MKTSRLMSSSAAAAAAIALAGAGLAPGVTAAPAAPAAPTAAPDIDGAAVTGHLQQLQDIAEANGGHRAFGSTGYTRSLEYIRGRLDAAGFETQVQTFSDNGTTGRNLVADWPGGDTSQTLMVGAHLDGVRSGPGINDNGTGSAATLEVALAIAKAGPTSGKHVRFAWWDAEEIGLVGSTRYVDSLTASERDEISGYYNFDMIGSSNAGFFVYDGDDSDGEGAGPGPQGSAAMETSLTDYFSSVGIDSEGTDFDGRSDYGPFIEAGIPAGGTFSGAEDTMTAAQAQNWDGVAGQPFDTCYHRACDTLEKVDTAALDTHSDAIAAAVWDQAGLG